MIKMKQKFTIALILSFACAALSGAGATVQAWHTVPTLTNLGYCQNQPPANWRTELTNRYGYDQNTDDVIIFCTSNSGRDLEYVFGPQIFLTIGTTYPGNTYQNTNYEDYSVLKSDVDSGQAKIINQNFYNGIWYDHSTSNSFTSTYNGVQYVSPVENADNNHNPMYAVEGSLTLLNPFNITDTSIYNMWLTIAPDPEILSWGFIANVNNKEVNFISQAGNAVNGGDIVKFEYDYLNNGTSYTDVTNNIQHTGSVLQHIEFGGWFMSHSYTFDNYGTYDVYMRVTDSNGKTAITHKLIYVNGETNSYITDLNNGELNPPSTSELINGCALQPDFPYFNIVECTSSVGKTLGLLKIDSNALKISGKGIEQQYSGCHYLSTIGDWLNTPNVQVCPQFSSEVRDTVSPFVGFMLGLIGLNFIVKRGKNEGDL